MQRRRRRRQEPPLRFEFAPPPPPTGPRQARRRRLRPLRFAAVLVLLFSLAVVSSLFGLMTAVAQQAPDYDQYAAGAHDPPQIGAVYARDPKKPTCRTAAPAEKGCWIRIGTLQGTEARVILGPNDISREMKSAIVAIEDRRFYEHKGFDPPGILRAVFNRVALGRREGGSTITQQLIKNTYLTPEQTVRRKFQEIFLAYQLERDVKSKPKILAQYLNTIYFGHGSHGVDAAARYYFNKKAKDLDVAEAALLAAIPKSPSEFDPLRNPGNARGRRDLVIDAMVAQGDISPAVGAKAKAAELVPADAKHEISYGLTRAPHFVEYVKELLKNRYGETVTFNGGLKVYTSIDLNEQAHAEKTIRDHLRGVGQSGTPLSGALVSIDPRDGEVRAMVGRSGAFNIAANGHRQPGSAFKPFVLAAAVRKGIQPDSEFVSRKIILQQDQAHYILVRNDFPRYSGPINLRRAMTESDNTVYAQLTQTVQPAAVVETAHDLGIVSPLDPNLAIGLGGLRIGVTPLEMAHAYSTLAARGRRVGGSILFHTPDAGYESPTQDPISILRVDHPDGRKDVNRPSSTPVMNDTDALSVIDSMRGVVNLEIGTGNAAALEGRAVIGKTGTTSDFKDAWFVGFTPQRSTAVWVGYVKPARSMARDYHGAPVFGGTYPAEIWHDFSRVALRDEARTDFPFSPGRQQDLYNVDVRRDPYVRAPFGCKGVQQLVMAVELRPADETTTCERGLTFVPDLHGLSRGRAADIADGQGLRFQYEFVAAEPGQDIDLVVDQVPDPGVQVPIDDPVRVFIARDVPLVRVPDVTGLSVAEAVAQLQAIRFRVVIEDGATDLEADDGSVVGQDQQAGTPAPRGAVVTIAVVGDVDTVEVPVVAELTVSEARLVLQGAGLTPSAERASGNGLARDDDVVIGSDVPAGQQVFPGSGITLRTGRRTAPRPVN